MIDASAGVEMALRTATGRSLRSQLPATPTFWAPEHYFVEGGAALRRIEVNGIRPAARVQRALSQMLGQPINRVSVRPLVTEAWAMRHNLTLGDALYVVVAAHLDAPLVTADTRLARSPGLAVTTITP